VLFSRPGVHAGVFAIPSKDVPAITLWSFCVGFYNLFLAVGLGIGVALWASGAETVGRTLVVYICVFMALCGLVLFVADRRGLGRDRGKGIGGVVSETVPPLLALIAMAF
jgi:putative membrane protein